MSSPQNGKSAFNQKYDHAGKLAIIVVGLPARNKSFIAQSLLRYLTWIGVHAKIFNLAEYRRRKLKFDMDYDECEKELHFSSWYYDPGTAVCIT